MATVDWIDAFIGNLGEITDGKKLIHAYKIYTERDLPEKINPEKLPAAVTWITSVEPTCSAGLSYEYTYGTTEFHIFDTVNRELYGELLSWIPLIRNKIYESVKLGGLVDDVRIVESEGGAGIRPTEMQFTSEDPWHYGIVVSWRVKQNVSTEVTVAAGGISR